MKVLYVALVIQEFGGVTHINEFVRHLREIGHDVICIFQKAPVISVFSKKSSSIPWFVKDIFHIFRNLSKCKNLFRSVKDKKPDLIYARAEAFDFSVTFISKLFRIPFVYEVNAPFLEEMKLRNRKVLSFVINGIQRLNNRNAGKIIVVSNTLKEILIQKGVPKEKIYVQPNGVDHRKFDFAVERISLPEANGRIIIGFVGSLNPWHGINDFVNAAEAILFSRQDIHFLIVGGTEQALKNVLEQIAEKNLMNHFTITGHVPYEKVPGYISKMDIVTLPYPFIKNFYFSPLKLFEYMAMKKVIVATKVGQIAEIIEHGVDGFLVGPGCYHDLEEALEDIFTISKQWSTVGENAYNKSLNYTWDCNARNINQILMNLVKAEL